jgi:hypothetical protein
MENVTKLCECGCGKPTPLATRTRRGIVAGQPTRFLTGHNGVSREFRIRHAKKHLSKGASKKPPNPVEHRSDGISILELRTSNGEVVFCYINSSDYDTVKHYHWHASSDKDSYYAVAYRKSRIPLKMHKLLLDADEVCFKDLNGLNNCRENLRVATRSQNIANHRKSTKRKYTSKYKGVFWCKDKQRWGANIGFNHQRIRLGRFSSEVEAARAYDKKALELYGEFARVNFPDRTKT